MAKYTVRAEFHRSLLRPPLNRFLFVRSFVRSFVFFFFFFSHYFVVDNGNAVWLISHILRSIAVRRVGSATYACGLGNVGQLGDGQSGENARHDHCSRKWRRYGVVVWSKYRAPRDRSPVTNQGDVIAGLPLDGLEAPLGFSASSTASTDASTSTTLSPSYHRLLRLGSSTTTTTTNEMSGLPIVLHTHHRRSRS